MTATAPTPCCAPPSTASTPLTPPSAPVAGGSRGVVPGSRVTLPEATREVIRHADAGSTDGMVRLDGGTFEMGAVGEETWAADGEGPIRQVELSPFYIDATAVTNAAFAEFIDATGYTTESERYGWSFVFHGHLSNKYVERLTRTNAVVGLQWWLAVPGACWRRPFGERSDLKGLDHHPVIHVSWNDAIAYCDWAG